METRKFRPGDREALVRLGVLAFGESVSDWEAYFDPEKNPLLDLDQVHAIEEDGEVRASATVLPLEVYVDGNPAPMGGVSAVMVHPAYRRRGYAGRLMRAVLTGMRERGTALSMLWPFAHSFYRSFGYELAGETVSYTLKPTDLPTSDEQKLVRAYREEDLPHMISLFEAEASEHQLCVSRSEEWWRSESFWDEEWKAAVYERDGRVEGYLIYKMSGWRDRKPPRELKVSELISTTTRSHDALISFLAAQDPLVFEIKHSTPRNSPIHPYLRSSYVGAEVSPEFMLRLADVEGALNLLKRTSDEPLVLEVTDDGIPENAGEYTVGGGEVIRGAEVEDHVSLDVRQLSQLYAGYLSAGQLARHELVKLSSSKALDLLEAYFPPGDPWVSPSDHF